MQNLIGGSEILLESLKREQVEVVFGLPGGAVLPLYDALYGAGIRHLLVRHEQAAGFAADGYARVTGKPGVCLVTSGPGATNALTALTSAMMDSIPVVALTGQVAAALIGKDAFQEADTIGISLPVTKHSFQPRSAADIPAVIHEAFKIAISGRPGPVLVDLPKSTLLDKAAPKYLAPEEFSRPVRAREWKAEDVEKAAEMLLESRRGLFYAGGGVIHAEAWDELRELAELLNIPVTTTLMGLGSFPSSHPLSLGMLGMHGSYATNMAVSECDLLVAVGARFDDRVTGRVDGFSTKSRKIHIDVDPSEINKNVRVDLSLIGDARETLRALIEALNKRGAAPQTFRSSWLDQIEEWRKEHPLGYDESAPNVKPEYVIEMISRYADEDAIIAVDVGQHQMWAAQYYDFYRPRTWLSSSGLGTMGYGFPAAMGAQLAFPDRQVIAIVGDGGFQMTLNDLATAAQYRVPVKIVILNNRALGMVRQWQEMFFEKRYCDIDLNYSPDFAKLAESYGIRGVRVEHKDGVKEAVRAMLRDREPWVLDFAVDPSENVYPIVPSGAALADMIVEPPRTFVEQEVVDDLWAV